MEGAEVRQERRQHAEVVQRLQEPDDKLQQEARHTGQQSRDMVERAVKGGVFDLVDEGVQLLIDLLRRVRRRKVELDGRLLAVRAHVLLDGHGELDIVIALIDALAGEEAVHAGVLCDAADIGRKQHMRQAEGLHALRALLADVALDLRNFERCLDGVAGIVACGHDVARDDVHRAERTDETAVLAVAPRRVVSPVRERPHREHGDDGAAGHGDVGDLDKAVPHGDRAAGHRQIIDEDGQRDQQREQQRIGHRDLAGDGQAIDQVEQQVQDPAHHDIAHIAEQGIAAVQVQVERRLSEVDAGPENGLRRAIEPRLPFQHELERKAEAHRHRQDLLEPDVHGADHGSLAEAEREDLQNDGSQRQGRGDPSQRVFPADIKTGQLFHGFPLFLGNL